MIATREKTAIPLSNGLLELKKSAAERINSRGSAVVLVFGDSGTGKSSLAEIVEHTRLGLPIPPPLVITEDHHSEADRFVYHLERGELPKGLSPLTVFTRLNSGLIAKNYGVGKEVIFVELGCDRDTQIENLVLREHKRALAAGLNYSAELIRMQLRAQDLDLTPIRDRARSSVYSDLLIDTSLVSRIDPEAAAKLF